ncbi:MAG: MaoC family dehydratase [Deltaproteobacteria bacterium]|nr:MaoC family dehydratase [Deltaproteobacteria bacterium]
MTNSTLVSGQDVSYGFSDLTVGQQAERTFEVSGATLAAFAEVTGDHNRVHLDQAYAEQTPFRGRIAHGMLTAGYISAVLANQLPGNGTVYLGQELKFRAPVRPGDRVTVRVTVRELQADKQRVVLQTQAFVGDKLVVDGTATVLPPGALK